MVPEFSIVPLMVTSVAPVPLLRVHVMPVLTVTCPPASMVSWSAVTFAETVTLCVLRMVMKLFALVGVFVVGTCQLMPSSEHSQVAGAFQLPVLAERYCVAEVLAQSAANAGVTGMAPSAVITIMSAAAILAINCLCMFVSSLYIRLITSTHMTSATCCLQDLLWQ